MLIMSTLAWVVPLHLDCMPWSGCQHAHACSLGCLVRSDAAVQGMEGIRKVFIREAKRTTVEPGGGAYKTENEWMLDTEGACCGSPA